MIATTNSPTLSLECSDPLQCTKGFVSLLLLGFPYDCPQKQLKFATLFPLIVVVLRSANPCSLVGNVRASKGEDNAL